MRQRATARDRILSTLRRGPKRGLTRSEIAARAGVNSNSVGTYLSSLRAEGLIDIAGQLPSTGGRPANRYTAA